MRCDVVQCGFRLQSLSSPRVTLSLSLSGALYGLGVEAWFQCIFFLHSKAYYLTTKDHKHIYMVTTHTTLDFALISNLYNNGKKSVCLSVRNKYDVMTYDIMTHDVMTYDVVTYDVMADDVMTNNDK